MLLFQGMSIPMVFMRADVPLWQLFLRTKSLGTIESNEMQIDVSKLLALDLEWLKWRLFGHLMVDSLALMVAFQ